MCSWKLTLIALIFALITTFETESSPYSAEDAADKPKTKEIAVAKAILYNQIVEPGDSIFEQKLKSLVSNFLVNTVVAQQQQASRVDSIYDYEDEGSTTTQKVFTWPPFFVTEAASAPIPSAEPQATQPTNFDQFSFSPQPQSMQLTTVPPTKTVKPTPNPMELDPPRTYPSAVEAAVQQLQSIVPNAIRVGGNYSSVTNRESVSSILKILGSVAFLNLSGVIDNSIQLGTSNPVRNIVFGVTNLVFCNRVVLQFNSGRCTRMLSEGTNLEYFLRD